MAHLQLESYPNLSLKSGTSSTGIRTSFLMERVAHHQLVYPEVHILEVVNCLLNLEVSMFNIKKKQDKFS